MIDRIYYLQQQKKDALANAVIMAEKNRQSVLQTKGA
jgi:hypothetical protein